MPVQFDREKFKDVVHYICANCAENDLGAVKLHKVLYFSDMLSFAFTGSPITGATYRKRDMGPMADPLRYALRELAADRKIAVSETHYFGYRKKQYTSLEEPDESRLNGDEKALLGEVIEFVCRNNSAKTISEFSHNKAWELAEFGEVLPYYSAVHMFPSQISDEALKWAAGERPAVEAARSNSGAVERRVLGTLRDRIRKERSRASGRV